MNYESLPWYKEFCEKKDLFKDLYQKKKIEKEDNKQEVITFFARISGDYKNNTLINNYFNTDSFIDFEDILTLYDMPYNELHDTLMDITHYIPECEKLIRSICISKRIDEIQSIEDVKKIFSQLKTIQNHSGECATTQDSPGEPKYNDAIIRCFGYLMVKYMYLVKESIEKIDATDIETIRELYINYLSLCIDLESYANSSLVNDLEYYISHDSICTIEEYHSQIEYLANSLGGVLYQICSLEKKILKSLSIHIINNDFASKDA